MTHVMHLMKNMLKIAIAKLERRNEKAPIESSLSALKWRPLKETSRLCSNEPCQEWEYYTFRMKNSAIKLVWLNRFILVPSCKEQGATQMASMIKMTKPRGREEWLVSGTRATLHYNHQFRKSVLDAINNCNENHFFNQFCAVQRDDLKDILHKS